MSASQRHPRTPHHVRDAVHYFTTMGAKGTRRLHDLAAARGGVTTEERAWICAQRRQQLLAGGGAHG